MAFLINYIITKPLTQLARIFIGQLLNFVYFFSTQLRTKAGGHHVFDTKYSYFILITLDTDNTLNLLTIHDVINLNDAEKQMYFINA